MKKTYDSASDTLKHIQTVHEFISEFIKRLLDKSSTHDSSKLLEPEKDIFDEYTPKLKDTTYGSDEYTQYLKGMQAGLRHHYGHNSHHPEHFAGGINDMSLMDIAEMLCDWKAATLRHGDGDLHKSIEINSKRFEIDKQMRDVLINTARKLGWL